MPIIRFINENKTADVAPWVTILEAARSADVTVESPCGGGGTCGKCRVQLGGSGKGDVFVNACQEKVFGDISVITIDNEAANKTLQILSSGQSFNYEIDPYITKAFDGGSTKVYGGDELLGEEPGDTTDKIYGIALDIGTTTMVAELINLKDGAVIASSAMLNPQAVFAQDVLSRIYFASINDGTATLYNSFLSAFGKLRDTLTRQAGVDAKHIYEVVYSGNTAMLHMATGTDPVPLGKYPYTSNIAGGESLSAENFGI